MVIRQNVMAQKRSHAVRTRLTANRGEAHVIIHALMSLIRCLGGGCAGESSLHFPSTPVASYD